MRQEYERLAERVQLLSITIAGRYIPRREKLKENIFPRRNRYIVTQGKFRLKIRKNRVREKKSS